MSLEIFVNIEELIEGYSDDQIRELKRMIADIEESRRPSTYLNKYILWVLNGFPDGLTMKQLMLITKLSDEKLKAHLDMMAYNGEVLCSYGNLTIKYRSLYSVDRKEFEEAGQ